MASHNPGFNSGYTFTTSIQPPPGPPTPLYLPSHPSAASQNPPIFHDAMKIRTRVFIDEQHCSADTEIDADDARSWQWVIYASAPETSEGTLAPSSTSTSAIPVAVIRLVPPPQLSHAALLNPTTTTTATSNTGDRPRYDWVHEPCIKLTRVAVLPEYRGFGLGRRLVETALSWAVTHAEEINTAAVQLAQQVQEAEQNQEHEQPQQLTKQTHQGQTVNTRRESCLRQPQPQSWRGLVLVHAQVEVEGMYRGLGFVTDEGLGRWDEEGIEHVGMFRRMEVR